MLFTPNKFPDINQIDLEILIKNKIEESVHLDYKDPKALSNNAEIAKDVSSFANSDGGNIIYGIQEDNHKPCSLIPINENGLREKIDQIAHNGIDPPLNIKIWPVDVNIENNKGQIFVVYIPKKYPNLHYAKKKNKFYKRTNFTSKPMERYEIELAYKQMLDLNEKLKSKISTIEKDFIKEIGQRHYKFIFTVNPTHSAKNLFKINKEISKFLYYEFPQTPIYNNDLVLRRSSTDMPRFKQNSFYFRSELGYHNGDCLIRTDGIILYILHFYNFSEKELKKTVGENNYVTDTFERLKRGIILNQREFDRIFFIDYVLGLLDFLEKFYAKIGYYGDIHIKFQVQGALHEWTDQITGNKYVQSKFEPIENDYNVELISTMKFQIIEDFFNPLFNGFGIMEEELGDFYKILKIKFEKLSK